jgi:hypothetical protein
MEDDDVDGDGNGAAALESAALDSDVAVWRAHSACQTRRRRSWKGREDDVSDGGGVVASVRAPRGNRIDGARVSGASRVAAVNDDESSVDTVARRAPPLPRAAVRARAYGTDRTYRNISLLLNLCPA